MGENRNLKPKLASDVQARFFKKDERGEFYIISRENQRSFLKVHGVGREILEMLDGNNSIAELEEVLKRKGVEVDLIRFIKLLSDKGFLENQQIPKEQNKNKQLLLHYIPLFKGTESILNKIYSVFHGFFRREVLLVFVLANFAILLMFLTMIFTGYIRLEDFFFIDNSVFFAITVYLFLIMPFLVVIHELAHGIACYHYGGKPQEMGVALFVFAPFFYMDTSNTWLLQKSQSIMVFLAGPFSTFFIGNLCFLLSLLLPTPYINPLRLLTFGSYLAVLFGFNPIMGSDGYYVLQTLTDFPNLSSHAWQYASMWFKRIFRLVSKDNYKEYITSYSRQERRILFIYAPFAFVINAVLICIMGYWGVFFVSDFWRQTLSIIEVFPNIPATTLIVWLIQSMYIFIIAFFLATTSKKLNRRLRTKRNS